MPKKDTIIPHHFPHNNILLTGFCLRNTWHRYSKITKTPKAISAMAQPTCLTDDDLSITGPIQQGACHNADQARNLEGSRLNLHKVLKRFLYFCSSGYIWLRGTLYIFQCLCLHYGFVLLIAVKYIYIYMCNIQFAVLTTNNCIVP